MDRKKQNKVIRKRSICLWDHHRDMPVMVNNQKVMHVIEKGEAPTEAPPGDIFNRKSVRTPKVILLETERQEIEEKIVSETEEGLKVSDG